MTIALLRVRNVRTERHLSHFSLYTYRSEYPGKLNFVYNILILISENLKCLYCTIYSVHYSIIYCFIHDS